MAKKNEKYWERRKVSEVFGYYQGAEDTADQIAALYLKASRYLSYQADDIFEKYQTKHGLSEWEARALLNKMKDKTSIDALLEELRSGSSDIPKAELLQQLEAPAYQARLDRLRQLQNQIDSVMENVYHQEKTFSTSFYTDLANEAYYRSIFSIQQQVDATFSFNHINAKHIDAVLNSRWSGENYSQRIWKNTQALAQTVKEELLINLITGRTNREVAQIISNKFGQGASNSRRLVRTESNHVSTELDFKAYEECGIEKYQYLATLDLRTSRVCRGLDGKIFSVKERQTGVNCPPMHPWCRSTTISIVDETLAEGMQRSAIDPATGKRIKVPRNMIYEQWYDKYVKGKPEAELEEKKIKNRAADRAQHKKYKEIVGDDVPEKLDDFQKMKYNNTEKWNDFKGKKQEHLNQMDFEKMGGLIGKLGNKETRLWYKAHDEGIAGKIDKSLPLNKQAEQAHELRNRYRTQARELMSDQKARRDLDENHPNPTFEQLMEYKAKKYGLTGDEAYKDIIRSSGTTNKKYDKIAGVEEG